MFTTIIVKPIFNLLVLVYALIPGHNFGISLIVFTIIVRILLWPLLKKQLVQAKQMRKLQPEINKIKKAAKKDKTKESQMLMELYKERGINPLSTVPILILQLVVLIGLYSGLRKVINNPHEIVSFAYPGLQHLGWLKTLSHNIGRFDNTLFGFIDLGKPALSSKTGVYLPGMVLVIGSAVIQFFQSKQLMPQSTEQKGLRDILKSASDGKQADQSEVNAAVTRSTRYFLPVFIFIFTVHLASALSLYWLTGGLIAFIQQSYALRQDESEMEALADKPVKKDVSNIEEAEVVKKPAKKTTAPNSSKKAKRRRSKR